ncbi:hypothetical protein B6R96_03500 [Streptomyces sp. Sge12]|nr:hypothetical protein B6R96_03500 [Streptomyces sp. Sge12]
MPYSFSLWGGAAAVAMPCPAQDGERRRRRRPDTAGRLPDFTHPPPVPLRDRVDGGPRLSPGR